MKTLFFILILCSSCASSVSIAYQTVTVNDSTFRQRTLWTFSKSWVTRSSQTDPQQDFDIHTYDILWRGDSIRATDYNYLKSIGREHTFKFDTTKRCVILTGKKTVTKYCK